MTEPQLYEALGRKQAELDALNVNYDLLLAVLARVSRGEILPHQIEVNQKDRTWAFDLTPVNGAVGGHAAEVAG